MPADAHLFFQNLSFSSPYVTLIIFRTLETTYDLPPTNCPMSRISLPSGSEKMYLTPAVVWIFSLSHTRRVSKVRNALWLTEVARPCTHACTYNSRVGGGKSNERLILYARPKLIFIGCITWIINNNSYKIHNNWLVNKTPLYAPIV